METKYTKDSKIIDSIGVREDWMGLKMKISGNSKDYFDKRIPN